MMRAPVPVLGKGIEKIHHRLAPYFFTLGLVLLIASRLSAGELIENFDKTFPLKKGHKLSLKNSNGTIKIQGWEQEAVRVEAVKKVTAGSKARAEELMRRVEIEIREEGGDLYILTRRPRTSSAGFWSWLFDGDNGKSSVSYTLHVPYGIIGDVRTVNGSVKVADFSGEIEVATTNGGIEIENSRGSVMAETTNGSISVEIVDVEPTSEIDLSSTNGRITLYLPTKFGGRISARTTNGSISTDFPIQVEGGIMRKRLEGTIGKGNNRCELSTTNGSIKIRKASL